MKRFKFAALMAALLLAVTPLTAQATPPTITFDGGPGTAAPPATLGPYTITPFGADVQPLNTNVTTVAGPTGTLTFSAPVSHRAVGSGWATWSHGYTGDVYYTDTATSVTMTMPAGTGAFRFYA